MSTLHQCSQENPSASALRAYYRQRNVLVIGADGFLGVNCIYALQRLGANVTIVSRRASPRAVGFTGRVLRGDVRDRDLVRAAIAQQSIVFDFAGTMGAVDSNHDPVRSLDEDCRPHLNLFQACAEASVSPLVLFCSSRLVYGKPQYLPVDEAHPCLPQSMYAVHKLTSEQYLQVLHQTHGLRFCILRLSNPYGPHQPLTTRGYGVLNQFILAASRGVAITLYGDGGQRRDYVYVADVITAFLLCAASEQCHGQIFNLGGRQSMTLHAAVQQLVCLAGGTAVHFKPWPPGHKAVETGDYLTDLRKIERHIALPPQQAFEAGLAQTLAYYRNAEATGHLT